MVEEMEGVNQEIDLEEEDNEINLGETEIITIMNMRIMNMEMEMETVDSVDLKHLEVEV